MAWKNDLEKSMDVFERLIKPVLQDIMSGEYIPVEGSPEEIAQMLDKRIGIDAMIDRGNTIYGLGSRIQIDSGVWNTFTIRCDRESGHITEYEKLRKAIKNDSMRPQITMQAYVENDELKSLALARTVDIIHYIDTHDCPERKSFDGKGWAQFKVVHWDKMKAAGFSIKVLDYRRIA
jgi:hypothetical protein